MGLPDANGVSINDEKLAHEHKSTQRWLPWSGIALEQGQTRNCKEAKEEYGAYVLEVGKGTSLGVKYASGSLPPQFQCGHAFGGWALPIL